MTKDGILLVALSLFAYFAGAVPFGYLAGKWFRGQDIRTVGSGNIGFANVKRAFGWGPGLFTLIGDILKGAIPTLLAHRLLPWGWAPLVVGFVAVAGHVWTCFLGFRGGKGVATSAGVFAALTPIPFLCALLTYALMVGVFRYSSLGSLTGTVVLVIVLLLQWQGAIPGRPYGGTVLVALGTALLIFYLHRGNIARLLRGEERALVGGARASGHPPHRDAP